MSTRESRKAAEILDEEVYKTAIQNAKSRMKDEWATASSPQQREALWHQYQAVEGVSRELRIIRDKGKANRTET